jgi:2-polyprenyl-3-methyl-5-hydroxy-6-metoxy-1,4-benzoquinol methylase
MNSHDLFVHHKLKKVSRLIRENSKVLKRCNYYAVDFEEKRKEELIKKGAKFGKADLNKDKIPFNDEKFDYIIMLDVLEHVVDPRRIISETKKMLNEGGKLIISLPNDYHILNKIRFVFNKHLTEDPFAPYGHLHYFPIKSGEDLISKQGCTVHKKIPLEPVKPKAIPMTIKKSLTKMFPQSFARVMIYVAS